MEAPGLRITGDPQATTQVRCHIATSMAYKF